jgi:multidrug transporter EmrE-like cation transporter
MQKLLISLYVLTTSSALIILKWGSKSGSLVHYVNDKIHLNLNFYTVSGIAFYGISFLIYTYLISKYDLGYIIPLTTALVYVLIFSASFIIFKESFTLPKLLGITFILLGIVFLNVSFSK